MPDHVTEFFLFLTACGFLNRILRCLLRQPGRRPILKFWTRPIWSRS